MIKPHDERFRFYAIEPQGASRAHLVWRHLVFFDWTGSRYETAGHEDEAHALAALAERKNENPDRIFIPMPVQILEHALLWILKDGQGPDGEPRQTWPEQLVYHLALQGNTTWQEQAAERALAGYAYVTLYTSGLIASWFTEENQDPWINSFYTTPSGKAALAVYSGGNRLPVHNYVPRAGERTPALT